MCSKTQDSPLNIGGFALDLAVYTCDGTFYRPGDWHAAKGGFVSHTLVSGDDGEAQPARDAELRVRVAEAGPERVRFQLVARHEHPIKAVKIALDLPFLPMLAPEEIGLKEATWRQWDFPRDWRTGFAIWQHGQRFFAVATKETPWRFKRLRALRTGDRMRLEIIQDASLRERTRRFESSIWEIGFRDELGVCWTITAGSFNRHSARWNSTGGATCRTGSADWAWSSTCTARTGTARRTSTLPA